MSKKQETQKNYEEFGALTKEQIAEIDKTLYGQMEEGRKALVNLKTAILAPLKNLLTKYIK